MSERESVDPAASTLQCRLMSCLEAILDMERDLERIEVGQVLLGEFNRIKLFMKMIDRIALDEEDVRRIEAATSNFLEELKAPLGLLRNLRPKKEPVQ